MSFQPVEGGLYAATPGVGQPVSAYWLLVAGSPPAGALDAVATWSYAGCYAFVPTDEPVTDPTVFAAALQALIASTQPTARWAAWVADPANVATTAAIVEAVIPTGSPSQPGQTTLGFSFPFANVAFSVPQSTGLDLQAAPAVAGGEPALVFTTSGGASQMGLVRGGGSTNLPPTGGQAAVPLGGAATGAVVFAAGWDRGAFYTFFMDDSTSWDTPPGNEIRYFYGPAGQEQSLRYPVFPGQMPSQDPAQALPLSVQLDRFAPWDPTRTLFALDLPSYGGSGPILPTCDSFATTDGLPLLLTPQAGAGFALASRPRGPSSESAPAYAYLTPTGAFAPPTQETPGIRHLMCGLKGTEYLLLAPDATVEFVPGGNAYASAFTPPSGTGGGSGPSADPCNPGGGGTPVTPGNLLAGTYTTAAVRAVPSSPASASIDRGYAVQPQASVYYGSCDSARYAYPLALGCRISELQESPSDPMLPVPMAPYGAVWSTGAETLPSADVLQSFESQIIASTRFAAAPKDSVDGPTVFDVVAHLGVDGGTCRTPEGLLAELNDTASGIAGTFGALRLAKSPNDDPEPGAAQLAFVGAGSPQVVAPDLSNALMNDDLFMVVTNPAALGGLGTGFLNELQMDEWTFRLDVGYTDDQQTSPTTILVFKFTTALSLVDLVDNAAYWQDWQTFIADDVSAVQTVQSQLDALLCMAKPDGTNDMFADFWTLATSADWTGIVALNCGLDAADLPPDLQDLLGGISGQLRAHHFGVTVNQIAGADSSDWTIDTSSLFALIHYEKDYAPPATQSSFGFQVLRLNVLFENSVLVHFDSRIAMTIPTLFGTEVVLETQSGDPNVPAGYNVIEIDGVYQKHGDTGTVVFDTTTPQIFTFKTATSGFRVLQEVYVTDAALLPVSSTDDAGTVTVQSSFGLSGTMLFVPDVSSGAQGGSGGTGLDLFSYGDATTTPANGLAFTSYAIAMTTVIQDDVGTLTAIGPDLTQFAISAATSQYRSQSLVASLPLQLVEFVQAPDSTGWPVTFSGASSGTFAGTYALRFQLSLGSLGALSAVADSLDVDLVLAWQAATGSSADAIWLLMVPPATMLGQQGFGLEGVLDTTFTNVEIATTQWTPSGGSAQTVYGIYLKNVQLWVLGIPIVPAEANFTLFADPSQGNASNLGWLMTFKSPITPG